MTTVLEYPCGCKYFSDLKDVRPMHMCDEHKVQAFGDALIDFAKYGIVKTAEEGFPINNEFLDKCRKVTGEYEKICGRWTNADQLNHIHDEVSEVSDCLRNKKDKYGKKGTIGYKINLEDELADVFLTTISLTNILQVDNDSINFALNRKLNVVNKRVQELAKR